jgi:hypothetical protein
VVGVPAAVVCVTHCRLTTQSALFYLSPGTSDNTTPNADRPPFRRGCERR